MDRIDYIMIGYLCFQVAVDLIRSIPKLPKRPSFRYPLWEEVSEALAGQDRM